MIDDPLAQILILLAAAVLVVALARRVGLPAILGYLIVGTLFGPFALGAIDDTGTTRLLAELGVVFLLFTLGLEFSWPRMVAMRREVFGIGSSQMVLTAGVGSVLFWAAGVDGLAAIALGGAVAVSSTAIIVQQLTEQSELNRTHGRVAFSVLLFQDLAFVPFLVLAGALATGSIDFSPLAIGTAVGIGALAVAAVLVASVRLHFLNVLLHLRYRGPNEMPVTAPFTKGQELGWFEHGSTLIVFVPPGFELAPGIATGQTVRMGQALLQRAAGGQ